MISIPIILSTSLEEYIWREMAKHENLQNIDWCEGGLQLADIETKNVVENDLNTRMKYIMVSIYN